jgi:hypothetical protein
MLETVANSTRLVHRRCPLVAHIFLLILGTATKNATVTVNNYPSVRKGRHPCVTLARQAILARQARLRG